MSPRILVLDIETAPALAYVWDLKNQFIPVQQVVHGSRMICFAAKWVGESRVMYFSEHHHGKEAMLAAAFELLDQADAVVTYNGNSFDIPHLNREFAEAKMGRPAPYVSIDLYRAVRKHHRFLSNKLMWVTERLELSGKMQHTGFQLWVDCMAGDDRAWNMMRRYNKQDVVTTEELYIELLPWLDSHPNFGLYTDATSPVCPKCGGTDLQKRGVARTNVSVYQRYQCQGCGTWSRGGKRLEGVDVR